MGEERRREGKEKRSGASDGRAGTEDGEFEGCGCKKGREEGGSIYLSIYLSIPAFVLYVIYSYFHISY